MAASLDNKPDQKSNNKSQEHYDKQFNELTSPDHMSKDAEEGSLYEKENNPEVDKGAPLEPWEQAKLDQMETGLREGHTYEKDSKPTLNPKLKVRRRWKRVAIGAGLFGLFGGTVGLIFFFLPTLRVAHLVNNIEGRFMGVAGNAIEQRAERLFSEYVRRRAFPIAQTCGNLVNPNCNAPFDPGQGYASRLYTNWSNARVEQKLFTDKGMRIEYNRGNQTYTIFRANGNAVDFLNKADFELGDFDGQDVNRNELRREIRKALKELTLWDRVMIRGPVRRLAKTKWNIRWCFFACNTRDSIRESTFNTSQKLKLKMIERTIAPFSDRLAVYFTCAVSDCTHTEYLRNRSQTLANAVESLTPDNLNTVTADLNRNNRRLSRVLVDKVFTRIFSRSAGSTASAAVPVVGIIYIVDALNEVDKKLYEGAISEFISDNAAAQYADFFLNFRVHHDEGIDGQLALDEVGAQSQIFDGLEGSLVYQREFGNGSYNREVLDEQYACADEQPIPEGELVCEERKVGKESGYDSWRQSDAAKLISAIVLGGYRCGFLQAPSIATGNNCTPGSGFDTGWPVDAGIHAIFSTFESIVGAVANVLIGALRLIPLVGDLIDWFTERLGDIMLWILQLFFPFIQTGVGPGNQVFDDFYAGANVVGNDFAKGLEDPISGELYGIGGKKLTDEEVQENLTYLGNVKSEDFRQESLYVRLLSPDNPSSLLSIIAGSAPINTTLAEMPRMILSFLSPLNIFSGLGQMAANPIYAQGLYQYQGDPFGIDQYGFAVDDPTFDLDPEEISEDSCMPGGELYEEWKEGIIGDDPDETTVNGQVQNTRPNPCMLELTTVNVLGSWFTDEDDGGSR